MRITSLPEAERPRERCRRLGPAALSAVELLALVLGAGGRRSGALGLAHGLLQRFQTLAGIGRARAAELAAVEGLGPARACALAAAFELGRRACGSSSSPLRVVEGPSDAAGILRPYVEGWDREAVVVLHLGARHQALQVELVALGALNAAAVEPREVFRGAIAAGAVALVVAHNHPSGCPEPSEDDIRLTRRLARCGETLGVNLLDHLVLGEGTFVSLKERGVV